MIIISKTIDEQNQKIRIEYRKNHKEHLINICFLTERKESTDIHYFSRTYKVKKKQTKKYFESIVCFVDSLTDNGKNLSVFHKIFSGLYESNYYFHEYIIKRFFGEVIIA